MRPAYRMDRGQVEYVESHLRYIRQMRLDVEESAVSNPALRRPAIFAATCFRRLSGPRKHLVPAAEAGPGRIHPHRELPLVMRARAPVGVVRHQTRQVLVERQPPPFSASQPPR